MEILILQAGEQIGPFSETQIREYLGQGLVAPSDLAACDGHEDWQPLDSLLADLSPQSRPAEMTHPDATPTEAPPHDVTTTPKSSQATEAAAVEEKKEDPSPKEPAQPLTATQKTRRKIVIQPILPLEPTALARKKPRTGKTAVTLEPLRPTTALPPVTGSAAKEKKTSRPQLRTGQLSLGLPPDNAVSDSSVVVPLAPPAPEPPPAIAPPLPAPAPAASLLPQPATLASPTQSPRERGKKPISPEILYTGIGVAFLVVCVLLAFVYLIFLRGAKPADNPTNPDTGPPQSAQLGPATAPGPVTSADYSDRGFRRQIQGDLDAAMADFEAALKLDPKNAHALYGRGLIRQTKGDADGATADYTEAINLNPKLADAFSNRAFIKQSRGDLNGALADYNEALSINPNIPLAYYNVALIKVKQNYLDEAIADYNRALDLDPKLAIAFYNRGVAKNTEGDIDGAIADFTQALSLDPKIALAFCDRGYVRQTRGDLDGALDDYSHAIALNPKLGSAFYNRGLIREQRSDLDGAIADNTAALALDPNDGLAYSNRALAEFGKGDLNAALADLRQVCTLAPRDTGADMARLYIWLIGTEQNPRGTADEELSTSLLNDWNSPPEDLSSKIAGFLLGHINESELIADAASPDPSREPGQYCKVWYFAGMKRLFNGDMNTAITYFQKSLATNQRDVCEYIFSRAQLQALGRNREISSNTGASPAQ